MPPADVVSEVAVRARHTRLISLFLDFDGTLVPIAADPALPRLDAETAATLRLLAAQRDLVTTIISGRALDDLLTRIGIDGLIYAGNHGLEICGRQFHFLEPVAAEMSEPLARLCSELAGMLRPVRGALVEYKRLTASVHFRLAADEDLERIRQIVYDAIARSGMRLRVRQGRKVFDIVPQANWHKGAAVMWINNRLAERRIGGRQETLLTVYLGDDTSDEDAFSALPTAVTIKVGVAETSARYRLAGPDEVHDFLRRLAWCR